MKIILKETQFKNIINIFLNESLSDMKKKYRNDGINNEEIERYTNLYQKYKNENNPYFYMNIDYLNNILQPNLRNNIDNFKNFEQLKSFIDYIGNQYYDINDKSVDLIDSETIVDNELITIQRGNTPKGCIEIKGEANTTWCVSSKHNNQYYYYRFDYEKPTFYFIKNKKLAEEMGSNSHEYTFFVIQVTNKGKYIVTNFLNEGDDFMSWGEIVKIFPLLNKYKNLLINVPFNKTESVLSSSNDLTDNEYIKLTYKQKHIFVNNNELNDFKFKHTPIDLLNEYIKSSKSLSDEQKDFLLSDKKFKELYNSYVRNVGVTFFKYNKVIDEQLFAKHFKTFFITNLKRDYENITDEIIDEELEKLVKNKLNSFNVMIIIFSNKETIENNMNFYLKLFKFYILQYDYVIDNYMIDLINNKDEFYEIYYKYSLRKIADFFENRWDNIESNKLEKYIIHYSSIFKNYFDFYLKRNNPDKSEKDLYLKYIDDFLSQKPLNFELINIFIRYLNYSGKTVEYFDYFTKKVFPKST